MARLKDKYLNEVVPGLQEQFKYTNVMAIPKLDKVVINIGDFRGVSPKSFDGRGNYSLGLKEQLIFPEIEYDKIDKLRGMEIVFATTAKTDEEGRALLKLLGMPFAS